MNGSVTQNNNQQLASEPRRAPSAALATATAMDASQREIRLPPELKGADILKGQQGAFEQGWNLCRWYIFQDNPGIKFVSWDLDNKKPA